MLYPDEVDELDYVIHQLENLDTDDNKNSNIERINWPSGPYFPYNDKPNLTLLTHENDEIKLDKDTSQVIRLLINFPEFQDNLKNETFVNNFIRDVIKFSGFNFSDDNLINKINWSNLIEDIKDEPQDDYETISTTYNVVYVDDKPYRQRQFSLPIPYVKSDGKINFPIKPSDVTLNKTDVNSSWLAKWVNPNTNKLNYIRFSLTEPLEEDLDLENVAENSDSSDSEKSLLSDSDSDSDDDNYDSDISDITVKNRPSRVIINNDLSLENTNSLVDFQALSNNERLLPLNMLVSKDEQTQILKRAYETKGKLVKDLDKVFDNNLQEFSDKLIETNDPLESYFTNYIDQRSLFK